MKLMLQIFLWTTHPQKYFEFLFSLSNLENFGDSLLIFHYQGLGFLTGWILFQNNYLRTLNHETNYAVNSTNESNCIFSDLFGFKTVNYVTKRKKNNLHIFVLLKECSCLWNNPYQPSTIQNFSQSVLPMVSSTRT